MASNEIRVGDIGTVYEGTIYDSVDSATPLNISSATIKQIIFRKPSGELLTVDASFSSDGSDGKLRYIFVDGDIDEHGNWAAQAYIDMPAGKWKTDIDEFEVYKNL